MLLDGKDRCLDPLGTAPCDERRIAAPFSNAAVDLPRAIPRHERAFDGFAAHVQHGPCNSGPRRNRQAHDRLDLRVARVRHRQPKVRPRGLRAPLHLRDKVIELQLRTRRAPRRARKEQRLSQIRLPPQRLCTRPRTPGRATPISRILARRRTRDTSNREARENQCSVHVTTDRRRRKRFRERMTRARGAVRPEHPIADRLAPDSGPQWEAACSCVDGF